MIEVGPEKYHCLGLWIDLLGTEQRYAGADVERIGREMAAFYGLCQVHLGRMTLPSPATRRRIDFGDTVYMDFATRGSQCVSLIPSVRTLIDAAGQNVQVLITEGEVYRPFQTETYTMNWEREHHPYQSMVDAQRREERERMFVGYSEPLKAAWRAEPVVRDPARKRSTIGIQATAIPYLADEVHGDHVYVETLGRQRGGFVLEVI